MAMAFAWRYGVFFIKSELIFLTPTRCRCWRGLTCAVAASETRCKDGYGLAGVSRCSTTWRVNSSTANPTDALLEGKGVLGHHHVRLTPGWCIFYPHLTRINVQRVPGSPFRTQRASIDVSYHRNGPDRLLPRAPLLSRSRVRSRVGVHVGRGGTQSVCIFTAEYYCDGYWTAVGGPLSKGSTFTDYPSHSQQTPHTSSLYRDCGQTATDIGPNKVVHWPSSCLRQQQALYVSWIARNGS